MRHKIQIAVSVLSLTLSGRAAALPGASAPSPTKPAATAGSATVKPSASAQAAAAAASTPPTPPSGAPPPIAPATPAEAAPPPPGGAAPPPARRARRAPAPQVAEEVRFEPDPEQTTLLILNREMPVYGYGYYRYGWWGPYRGVARTYAPVCQGPCSARFAPGAYDLALEKNGRIARTRERVVITRPSVLHGQFVDRSGVRLGGVVIGVTGVIAGTIMMIASVHRNDVCTDNYCYYHDDVDSPLLAGGIALAVGSAIAGSIMVWQRDEAVFSVLPLHLSSLYPREGASAASRALPDGAALAVRF